MSQRSSVVAFCLCVLAVCGAAAPAYAAAPSAVIAEPLRDGDASIAGKLPEGATTSLVAYGSTGATRRSHAPRRRSTVRSSACGSTWRCARRAHADGGAVENLGLLALLARPVRKEHHGLCQVFAPEKWHDIQRGFRGLGQRRRSRSAVPEPGRQEDRRSAHQISVVRDAPHATQLIAHLGCWSVIHPASRRAIEQHLFT
jgi:hypothetical protein